MEGVKQRQQRKAKRTLYQAKCKIERKRLGNVMRKDDQKFYVVKISKKVARTNQDFIGNQCVWDDGMLAVKDEYKK